MVSFLSSEQRQRHRFIDASIENYSNILHRNVSGNGYIPDEKVATDRSIISNLEVPNLRHGVLHMSRKALRNDSYIPIWPVLRDEQVEMSPESTFSLHRIQKEKVMEYFRNRSITINDAILNGILAETKEYNSSRQESDPSLADINAKAVVRSQPVLVRLPENSGKNRSRQILGRPYVILGMNNEDGDVYARTNPDTFGHELTHIAQTLANPVHRYDTAAALEDKSFRDELLAYSDQETILAEMARQNYTPQLSESQSVTISEDGTRISHIFLINNLRRDINKGRTDKHFPDGKLRKEFAERKLEIHKSLPDHLPRHTSLIGER